MKLSPVCRVDSDSGEAEQGRLAGEQRNRITVGIPGLVYVIASKGIGQTGCDWMRLYDRQTCGPGVATVPSTPTVAVTLQPVPRGANRNSTPPAPNPPR